MLTIIASWFHYFESSFSLTSLLSGQATAFALILSFAALSNLELHNPKLKQPQSGLKQSYRTNLSLLLINSIAVSLLSVSTLFILIEMFTGKGLLNLVAEPALKIVLSFLLLDLLHFFWHSLCHRFDSLWMFHKVHHSDPYVNVSTAYRIHAVELLLTGLLKAAYIVSLGIDKKTALVYETLYPFFVMFHHTNIAFTGEKLLGYVIITPSLHRTHHSKERAEHDSNYGAILSLWDRLFGTLSRIEPAEIGIKSSSPQSPWGLIKFGFTVPATAQSPATVVPALAPAATQTSNEAAVDVNRMIAEAAYYKAEKRAFLPGYELYDWLEAKNEILQQLGYGQCLNC